jgi:hypothetical protein
MVSRLLACGGAKVFPNGAMMASRGSGHGLYQNFLKSYFP